MGKAIKELKTIYGALAITLDSFSAFFAVPLCLFESLYTYWFLSWSWRSEHTAVLNP